MSIFRRVRLAYAFTWRVAALLASALLELASLVIWLFAPPAGWETPLTAVSVMVLIMVVMGIVQVYLMGSIGRSYRRLKTFWSFHLLPQTV